MVSQSQSAPFALIACLAALGAGCGPDFLPKQARFTMQPCAAIAAADLSSDANWELHPEPVLEPGPPGAWDSVDVLNPSVVATEGRLWNFYSGFDGQTWRTGLAVSEDGVRWTKSPRNPLIEPDLPWEGDYIAANGFALYDGEQFLYWYHAGPRNAARIGLARSPDGVAWRKEPEPALTPGAPWTWDESAVADPYVFRCNGAFFLYYLGQNRFGEQRLGAARSSNGKHWQKSHRNPLLEPGGRGAFDERGLGEPAVISSEGVFWMLYAGRDAAERRRLGWASSPDGVRWEKRPKRGLIAGDRPWNEAVLCDPAFYAGPAGLTLWFGAGSVPSPDENMSGRIGVARMR